MNDPHVAVRRLADELNIDVERVEGGYVIPDEHGPMHPDDAAFYLVTEKAHRWRLTSQWRQAA